MCGISGCFIGKHSNKSNEYLLDSTKTLSEQIFHRGPDSGGLWTDEKEKIFFAHNRLKIIDLSKQGDQPMKSYSENLVIIYNGEIYNHEEIKYKLLKECNDKIKFRNRTDTEVLINAIEFWGIDRTLNIVKGMYSFALWNKLTKKLVLCRDRFGEKPLYYLFNEDGLYFSSEIKSFKSLNIFNSISHDNFNFFLNYGYNLNNNTIFSSIKKIPPGSYIEFDKENLNKKTITIVNYWDNEEIAKKSLKKLNKNTLDDICSETENILKKIIEKQLIADVKTGVFLSGGIDSSLVTALAQKQSNTKISTFSIGFDVKDYDESDIAKKTSKLLNTNHHEYIMTSSDLINILEKKTLMDEPFYDVSQYPTYLLSKFTAQHVKVCLSGDGGDEIFGGYNRYLINDKLLKITKFIKLLKLQGFVSNQIDKEYLNFFLNKIGLNQLENKKDKLKALIFSESEPDLYEKLLRVENTNKNKNVINYKKISNLPNNFMINDTQNYLPNNILYKVDALSMLNSLEVRAPFLDNELFEYAWSIPFNLKFYKKKSKFILKKILSKYLNEKVLNMPKMGFDIPLFTWMNKSEKLRNIIKDYYFTDVSKINDLIPKDNINLFEINKTNIFKIWKTALMKKWIIENYK